MLREPIAAPAALLPAERALAFLEQQKVDAQIALTAENRRLLGTVVRNDKDRSSAANKRLQAEIDENTRPRKELEARRPNWMRSPTSKDRSASANRALSHVRPDAEVRQGSLV